MFLSNVDLKLAIDSGALVVIPPPSRIDATSIDLHLDSVSEARIWDIEAFRNDQDVQGQGHPELRIGKFKYPEFSRKYLAAPPKFEECGSPLVVVRDQVCIVRPGGFLLWQTSEVVGTPHEGAELICFVEGKSTRARTGILVHLTAPTIHSAWQGKITLEIANLGPFDLLLHQGDVIAQLTVARITSPPDKMLGNPSVTFGQQKVTGQPE